MFGVFFSSSLLQGLGLRGRHLLWDRSFCHLPSLQALVLMSRQRPTGSSSRSTQCLLSSGYLKFITLFSSTLFFWYSMIG